MIYLKHKYFLVLLFLLHAGAITYGQELSEDLTTAAQEIDLDTDLDNGSGPSVQWSTPPRFLSLFYSTTGPFDLNSNSNVDYAEDDTARVTRYEEVVLKVKFPVRLKGRTRIIGGFQYRYHEYNFEDPENETNELYRVLDDKHLNRLRLDAYIVHDRGNNKFIVGKGGIQASGDYRSDELPFFPHMKFAGSVMHMWKLKPNLSVGAGGYYSYQAGRNTVYPALALTYWKNKRWGIETLFPAQASYIRRFSKDNFLSAQYSIASARYLVATPGREVIDNSSFALARNDVQFFLQWQRSAYKFVWLSIAAGYNINFNLDIRENQMRGIPDLIENRGTPSPFIQAGFFLTIPESLQNR